MAWLIGIYALIGIIKALGKLFNENPVAKPIWMVKEKNPLVWSLYFCIYVMLWPIMGR